MRLSTILSEAARNLASGTSRALLFACLLAGLIATLALADTLTITALQARAEQFRDSGAAIRTLVAEHRIDARSCDALATTAPISASGAITAAAPVTFSAMPATSIPAFDVTPGFADVLRVDAARPDGIWISAELADTLRTTPGDTLPTTSGRLIVAGTFTWPDDGRDRRLASAILIPTRFTAPLSECWATIWPTSAAASDLLKATAIVDLASTTPLTLSQVNKNHGTTLDGNGEYGSRLTRNAPILGSLIGLLLGYTSTRLRRLEYAGALHAGARTPTILATALIETLVWGTAGAVIGTAVLTLLAAHDPGNVLSLVSTGTKTVVAAVASAGAGTTIATLSIRERHLFRYFRDR